MRLILRLVVNAVALLAAARLVEGFSITGWASLGWLALIFGVVNAVIRPVFKLFTFPLLLLTLGLFTLVTNTLMLMLAVWFGRQFGLQVAVDGFWSALPAALVVSIVSFLLSWLVPDGEKESGTDHEGRSR